MRTTDLSHVLNHPGPFATVLVEVSQDTEHGAHEHETRVRDAVRELGDQGAPPEVIDAVQARLDEAVHQPAPVARLVVGTPEGIVYDETALTRVPRPVSAWQPLPDLASWIAHRDSTLPFVLVLVDHEGGDISLWDSDVPHPQAEVTAGGEVQYVHKVPTGGWASIEFQRTSEQVWRRNADEVAEEVTRLVRQHGHPVVLMGGDPASCGMLRRDLTDLPAEVVTLPTGQRSADGGDEALHQAIREALFHQVVSRRIAIAERLREALGRGNGAATGVRDVAEAFVKGQVETLLIDADEAATLELEPEQFPGLAWGEAHVEGPVRADEALIGAAIATDAEVAPLPSAVLGGAPVAALLRWSESA